METQELSYVCDFGVRLPQEMQQAQAQRAEQALSAPRKLVQPKKPRSAARHDVQEVTHAQAEEA